MGAVATPGRPKPIIIAQLRERGGHTQHTFRCAYAHVRTAHRRSAHSRIENARNGTILASARQLVSRMGRAFAPRPLTFFIRGELPGIRRESHGQIDPGDVSRCNIIAYERPTETELEVTPSVSASGSSPRTSRRSAEYTYIYIYIYIYIYRERESYIYIYIYIERERVRLSEFRSETYCNNDICKVG